MKICKGHLLAAITATTFFFACSNGRNENSSAAAMDTVKSTSSPAPIEDLSANKSNKEPLSSVAAVAKANDSIIRTANLKFKVKNVYQATTAIEDIAVRSGGFVTTSNLNSTIDQINTTELSADSLLETTLYTVTNSIIIRVPNTSLDTSLKSMAYLIDYLDYRNIKAEDTRLQFLQSQLIRNRLQHHTKRIEKNIDDKGRKLTETLNAEDNLLNTQEQADNALLDHYMLKDKVNFSTITIDIYQHQGIKRTVIANHKNIEPYKPGILKRLLESLQAGCIATVDILLFFASIWEFILLAFIVLFVYRKYFRKTKV